MNSLQGELEVAERYLARLSRDENQVYLRYRAAMFYNTMPIEEFNALSMELRAIKHYLQKAVRYRDEAAEAVRNADRVAAGVPDCLDDGWI